MYQSAAHNLIPQLAECFSVPLIREPIRGTAKVQTISYDQINEEDEVEDLYRLLKRVVLEYPQVQGVSCGAIASTYQRLRVEQICHRLGLQSLAYLWFRSRQELLDEIISSMVDAMFVKVAGAGLDPFKHLGKSISTSRIELQRLHKKFGLDLCGEGGEYETFTLNLPSFQKRINILSTKIILDSEDPSVGNLCILDSSVIPKQLNSVENIPKIDTYSDIFTLFATKIMMIIEKMKLAKSFLQNPLQYSINKNIIYDKCKSIIDILGPETRVDGYYQTPTIQPDPSSSVQNLVGSSPYDSSTFGNFTLLSFSFTTSSFHIRLYSTCNYGYEKYNGKTEDTRRKYWFKFELCCVCTFIPT
jgi:diphthine-ammonia ligase